MSKTRVNSTGDLEHIVEPEGMPALWISDYVCPRCEQFGRCRGLSQIDDEDWTEIEAAFVDGKLFKVVLKKFKKKYKYLDLEKLQTVESVIKSVKVKTKSTP